MKSRNNAILVFLLAVCLLLAACGSEKPIILSEITTEPVNA